MDNELNAGFGFIDELLLKHRISLRTLGDYAEKHMEDLEKAESIFDLKNEREIKLCLALFRLMAGKYAAAIGESFCGRYHITDSPVDDIFFEQNKLFLIAAFVYNPSFFAMSWNLCGIIRSELAFAKELQVISWENIKQFPRFHVPAVNAASSADGVLREIASKDIVIEKEGVFGKLGILANNRDTTGIIQFRFKFNEFTNRPPYYLRVRYTCVSDNTERIAELKNVEKSQRNRELFIYSQPQSGIPYGDGLTIGLDIQKHG